MAIKKQIPVCEPLGGDDSNLVESRELKEGALSWNDFHNIEKEVPS
jgi:hypothetical protein